MSEIKEILLELGYEPIDDKDGWRMAAKYRSGDNCTALKVYRSGFWQDFVDGTHGKLEDLIALTLGDKVKAEEYIKGNHIIIRNTEFKEKIKLPEIFDKSILKELIPDFTYFENRGISLETCKIFKGGLCLGGNTIMGKLKNRQVLNIYDSKNDLIAFTGRSIDDRKPKWKHIGTVTNSIFPGYLNHRIIREEKEVFLVESPLCVMKLWDTNIKNSLCLFGVECSFAMVNFLLKTNPKKIFISLNNEIDLNGGVGNRAAEKIFGRLKKYFNYNQIKIYLPPAKDFAEIKDPLVIKSWWEKRND